MLALVEADVLAEVEALVDADVLAEVEALVDADVLADVEALVDADVLALVDALAEAEVLAEVLALSLLIAAKLSELLVLSKADSLFIVLRLSDFSLSNFWKSSNFFSKLSCEKKICPFTPS